MLTIVALASTNANMGLPGIRPHTLLDEIIDFKIDGVRWQAENSVHEDSAYLHHHAHRDRLRVPEYKRSWPSYIYETRGWTFQERLLSTRCVYFTQTRPIFGCHGTKISFYSKEDTADEDTDTSFLATIVNPSQEQSLHLYSDPLWMSGIQDLVDPDSGSSGGSWSLYSNLIEHYSSRELSYPKDALNAFAGCIGYLERYFNSHFLYGMPERLLDHALLFRPVDIRYRRTEFPSWSWVGWNSFIKFQPGHKLSPKIKTMKFVRRSLPREVRRIEVRYPSDRMDTFLGTEPDRQQDEVEVMQALLCFDAETVPMTTKLFAPDSRRKPLCHFSYDSEICGFLRCDTAPDSQPWTDAEVYQELMRDGSELISLSRESLFDYKQGRSMPYVNVMLIRREGDTAERITIGQIEEHAWQAFQPQMKYVMLS
jgi:hypothetical protein